MAAANIISAIAQDADKDKILLPSIILGTKKLNQKQTQT